MIGRLSKDTGICICSFRPWFKCLNCDHPCVELSPQALSSRGTPGLEQPVGSREGDTGKLQGLLPPGAMLCSTHTVTVLKVSSWSAVSPPRPLSPAATSLHVQVSRSISARSLPGHLGGNFQFFCRELVPRLDLRFLTSICRSWFAGGVLRSLGCSGGGGLEEGQGLELFKAPLSRL